MTDYPMLCRQLQALADSERHYVPLLANASALLYETLPDLNWAGFYLVRGDRLVLGPFQGKTACIHIARGKGVCGAAWRDDAVQRVDDVHAFPGHIACDGASNAEIVIPLRQNGRVVGVLDIDSPCLNRFTVQDQAGLEEFARILENAMLLED
ncbi:MAG: GAF domain-containing protein [Clostridia bacterium]|nr:GAF domain-containing protein [Clostridia bacterium]